MKLKLKYGLTVGGIGLATLASFALAQDQGIQAVIGNVFLQNTTPGTAQVGHATITGTFRAGQVFVQQASTTTIPVVGNNTAVGEGTAVGGSFSSGQKGGAGVRGTATSPSGASAGVLGEARSVNGLGVYGRNVADTFVGAGVKGEGVKGPGVLAVSISGPGMSAQSETGIAVQATNSSGQQPTISAFNFESGGGGVALRAGSQSGRAIYGIVTSTSGITTGVLGETKSATGFGVFSIGEIGATGTKSFVIDHPLDPENRYLKHYCAEGDMPRNVYVGRVTTDGLGYATVRLPSYFAAINKNPEYTLTVIDSSADFILAKVSKEIHGNIFEIRTSKPSIRVSWRVEAVRNDRWVQRSGIEAEPKKPQELLGTYLVPELYGKPDSRAQWPSNDRSIRPPLRP